MYGKMRKNSKLIYLGVLVGLAVAGCSTGGVQSKNRLDYLKANSVNPLELPPDLTRTTSVNQTNQLLSQYEQQKNNIGRAQNVLASSDSVRLERAGSQRWISTSLPADLVWTRANQLFREVGLPIEVSNPRAGLLESGWVENRADVPDTFIRKLLSSTLGAIFSSPTRDKFKLRLEPSNGRTLVYITHYGMKDQQEKYGDTYTWVDRPRDPELEAEMLSRLMAKLGATNTQEHNVKNAVQVTPTNGGVRINRPANYVFPQVGSLLDDGAVFKVESQNSNTGEYHVVQRDATKKTGSALAFWKKREPVTYRFNIRVVANGNSTMVYIDSLDGYTTEDIIKRLQTNFY